MYKNFLISLPEITARTENEGPGRMEDIVICPENEKCDLGSRKDYDPSGMHLWFEFHDGIAYECTEGESTDNQLAILYPTMEKCLETPGMKEKVEDCVGEAARGGNINFHDIALTFGRVHYREDLDISERILSILREHPVVVASWGLDPDTLRIIKGGIEFHVQGFRHAGMVQITWEKDNAYEVRLVSESGEVVLARTSVSEEDLTEMIDLEVEKTENYGKRIDEEYGISAKRYVSADGESDILIMFNLKNK